MRKPANEFARMWRPGFAALCLGALGAWSGLAMARSGHFAPSLHLVSAQQSSPQADNAGNVNDNGGSITGSTGTAANGGGGSQDQTKPGKVTAGQPPGATRNEGVNNTANGQQSGSGNQAGGGAATGSGK